MSDHRGGHGAMSRAQQFEDEKKRIMQSCFAKQDVDGVSLLESYITHCRIVEDSASPSAPPPDGRFRGSPKDRLIFVAVRKSGRVRMHKARENNNGTFSIGKTWNLDDLQTIQVHGPPNERGFTVTILKPYYWQAGSPKEKDFFISSLVKIYKKYTGGKIPELVGFKKQELEALLGSDAERLMEENRRDRMGSSGDQHMSHSTQASTTSSTTMRSMSSSSNSQPAGISSTVAPAMEKTSSQRSYGAPAAAVPRPTAQAPRPSEIRAQRSAGDLSPRRPEMPTTRPPTSDRERPSIDNRRPSGSSVASSQNERQPPGRSLSTSKSEWDMRPGSSTSNGAPRAGSRPPMPEQEDKDVRRVPSLRERLRAPSSGSQTSDTTRRAEEREPMPRKSSERERSREPPQAAVRERPRLNREGSNDLANRFRQAANAYNAVGVFSNQNRPRTPSTPRSATPNSMKESTRVPTEPVPSIPPLRFSEEKRPSSSSKDRDDGTASIHSTSSRGKQSAEEAPSKGAKSAEPPSLLRAGPPPGSTPRPQQQQQSPPSVTPVALRPGPPAASASRPSQQQENDTPAALRTGPVAVMSSRTKDPEPLAIAKPRPNVTREVSEPTPTEAKKMTQPVPTVTESLLPLEKVRSAPPPASQAPLGTLPSQSKPTRLHDPPIPQEEPKSPATPTVIEPTEPRERPQSLNPIGEKKQGKKTSSILEKINKTGLSIDLEAMLDEFQWDANKSLDQLQADVKKELSQVESNNVIVNLDHDGRVDQLSSMLDKAIKECEEMDALLTLYAVELSSLNDDIFHIENQSQGLQVQTANQKTLQKELGNLLDTISISSSQLKILKQNSLKKDRDIREVEQILVVLYKAVKTIEGDTMTPLTPTPGSPRPRRGSFAETPGIGSMRALQDKKDDYRHTCRAFLSRVHQCLESTFAEEMKEVLHQSRQQHLDSQALTYGNRPHLLGHDMMYHDLWKYASLLSFVRDIDPDEYALIQQMYERAAKHLFQEEFREHVLAWKKITKTLTTEEAEDLVFTTTEKEPEHSAVTAARKLTVKKSIARIRGDSMSHKERPLSHSVGIIPPYESFQGAFTEMTTLVLKEQNFIVEFFALSSLAPQDFLDFMTGPDSPRRLGDLGGLHAADPDKVRAKQVMTFMKDLFSFLPQEFQGLVDWAVGLDPTQVVGAMYAIEQRLQKLEETDQDFLDATLKELLIKLQAQWKKFVEDQVKAIEETKVKLKKRKGVVTFIRVFPIFATHIEAQLPHSTNTPVRQTVNDSYSTLNTAIFDTLLSIANSLEQTHTSNSLPPTPSTPSDPEDKAALNHHITLIENLHHYITALTSASSSNSLAGTPSSLHPPPSPSFAPPSSPLAPSALTALQPFISRAQTLLTQHIAAYTLSILHRPVGKLLDFITSLESLLQDPSTTDPSAIPNRPQFSRHSFKKILREHDGKEVRKGIEALRKRVEKHFLDDEDRDIGRRSYAGDRSSGISIRSGSGTHIIPGSGGHVGTEESQELVRIVLDKCEEELVQLHKRTMLVLVGTPYKDMGLELEFTVADIRAGFKK
ncbi:hypothetical protein EX30DRAFT_214145 [Ascodesmis nigricans]|uniref:Exocyst complex component Sec3 PIP2-binding N-terminal domain-containing protein n=1 Tax=Ascodesmis nigricans TaxID=341454 RepID=A0A4S2MZ49_9PEZI|nr:hypothetical protein EX30DRAFT_214145 [Ascodesmis nigricans]